jgi:hypothetical protein
MTLSKIIKTKIIILVLLLIVFCRQGYSQFSKIDWNMDTVSNDNAEKSKDRFHAIFQGNGRKTTRTVTFNVEELKTIIDDVFSLGDSVIQFQFALLRAEDTARYISRHAELTDSDKNDLINRPVLLIKVPRAVISKKSFGASADAPLAAGSMFINIGKICPPPSNCKN